MQAQLVAHEALKLVVGYEPPKGTTTYERFKHVQLPLKSQGKM